MLKLTSLLRASVLSANPESSWFGVCQPDVPCITPGTYAFLGAAAALWYALVPVLLFLATQSDFVHFSTIQRGDPNDSHRRSHHV